VRNVRHKQTVDPKVRERCIDDFTTAFTRYGMPLTLGRAFGLLLVSDEPLGLDDIAAQLSMSKSAASRTMRDLETIGIVRRQGTPGSRRVLFAIDDAADSILDSTMARIKEFRDLFAVTGARLGGASTAAKRLEEMSALYDFMATGIDRIRRDWQAQA
jgi:DNA-binding transcriptional regulator GbsR (MarR family)